MKIAFLYEGPHAVHAAWAKSVNAKFIPNFGAGCKKGSSFLSRLVRIALAPAKLRQIPKNTNVLLLEGGLGFVVGFLFKKIRKKKVLMIASDPLFYELKRRPFLAKIGYFMMKNFDGFIPTSKLMSSLIPFKNKKIVHPFAEVERFNKVKVDLNKKNIIYVGVLNKQKGVDRVIKLFLKLQKKIPKAKLFLVGEGPLKKEIEKINNKNIILTGFVKNPESYMKECSIYTNLSRLDPFGVGVVEAMVHGLVTIVSEGVGAKDIIEKVDKTLIVDSEEKAVIKILDLFSNRIKLTKLSQKLKKKAIEECSKEKSIKKFKKAFYSFI